jgi:7-cyano-7-deazaguanine reductase
MSRLPLGKATEYPQEYAPGVLFAVARADAREPLGLSGDLPFHGKDTWTAWEFTWLDPRGQPRVAIATFQFDAWSPNIVESKSLKLYLGSFAMTRIASDTELVNTLANDLGAIAGAPVGVGISQGADANLRQIGNLPGVCVDQMPMARWPGRVEPDLLKTGAETVTETLHSHLLRSLCPVTSQPDMGSVMIRYRGPRIDPVSFLEYVVSFRQHEDFHETCVERMYLDLRKHCQTAELTVYAAYNRRGGIDINPFRSDFENEPPIGRLWRQ